MQLPRPTGRERRRTSSRGRRLDVLSLLRTAARTRASTRAGYSADRPDVAPSSVEDATPRIDRRDGGPGVSDKIARSGRGITKLQQAPARPASHPRETQPDRIVVIRRRERVGDFGGVGDQERYTSVRQPGYFTRTCRAPRALAARHQGHRAEVMPLQARRACGTIREYPSAVQHEDPKAQGTTRRRVVSVLRRSALRPCRDGRLEQKGPDRRAAGLGPLPALSCRDESEVRRHRGVGRRAPQFAVVNVVLVSFEGGGNPGHAGLASLAGHLDEGAGTRLV